MGKSSSPQDYFDKIYIGTGPILVFDAINETCKERKVILIDKSHAIGGAWKLLNIYDQKNIENAVHYLMPNKQGYDFINKNLNIKLVKTRKKLFAQKLFKIILFLPTNRLGHFLNCILNEFKEDKFSFKRFLLNISGGKSSITSVYPKNGCKTIIKRMIELAQLVDLDIILNKQIDEIKISTKGYSRLKAGEKVLYAKQIVISHGFLPIDNLFIDQKKISIEKKFFRRPSLHIIFSPKNLAHMKKIKSFSQVIFPNNSQIKYAHEITKYIPKDNLKKGKYVLVIALKHDLINNEKTYKKVKEELQEYKLIPDDHCIEEINFYWQEIFLPALLTSDLEYLESISNGKFKIMLTEELNTGFGLYSREWKELKKLLEKANFKLI